MSDRQLRVYEYVPQPYLRVRDALLGDTLGIFRRATHSASDRARALAVTLKAEIGAIEVGAEVQVRLIDAVELDATLGSPAQLRFRLGWQSVQAPGLFPVMDAVLAAYALSPDETQLDLFGLYQPPLGVLGAVIDDVVGHRVAEASVHRFIADLAAQLASDLAR